MLHLLILVELIHFTSAGTDAISKSPIYTSTDITLTTSSGIHGPMISEWVIMTSLVSSHLYNTMHDWQKEHKWGKDGKFTSKVFGLQDNVDKRFAVLGYGSIGRQSARVAKAMGMDVIAYTASPRDTKESKKDTGFIVPGTGDPEGDIPSAWYSGLDKESLHHFLAQDIDHLLISVPLTDDTEHFLGAEEFEILGRKKRGFVTNISRGQIIKQDDLIASLNQGADKDSENGLRGAALDVTDPEPLPADSELWDAPNCIVTPHISGLSTRYMERSFQVLQVNLAKRAKGKKLINVVNRKKGY